MTKSHPTLRQLDNSNDGITKARCSDCNEFLTIDELDMGRCNSDEGIVCEECDSYYHTCHSCGDVKHDDNTYYYLDSAYYEECFYDNHDYCTDCGNPYHSDDLNYVNDRGWYCEECFAGNFFNCPDCCENFAIGRRSDTKDSNGDFLCHLCARNPSKAIRNHSRFTLLRKSYGVAKVQERI